MTNRVVGSKSNAVAIASFPFALPDHSFGPSYRFSVSEQEGRQDPIVTGKPFRNGKMKIFEPKKEHSNGFITSVLPSLRFM